ncbi:MAG: MBL fold metallo-hydrolase [Verrucomicrobiales bacterium]|nr:MBL fold metallo-hydrolase [Verrucomicrobiales bacterium]
MLQIRMPMVCCYALRQGDAVYLIDTGFVGGAKVINRALQQRGWGDLQVEGILLTHGHLDHTLNAARLADEYGAWVMAPEKDKVLLEGDFSGDAWGKVGGWMQQAAALVLRYKMADDIIWYQEDTSCDLRVEGLQVSSLPGHTAGHSGFLYQGYLFCGDLFASHDFFTHLPPSIFNQNTVAAKSSLLQVAEMDLEGVFPCHCDRVTPEVHLSRLLQLAAAQK